MSLISLCQFAELVRALFLARGTRADLFICPAEIMSAFFTGPAHAAMKADFQNKRQQDTQESLTVLLNQLHEGRHIL
jgi:ubiquitin C-terminal hydrolase